MWKQLMFDFVLNNATQAALWTVLLCSLIYCTGQSALLVRRYSRASSLTLFVITCLLTAAARCPFDGPAERLRRISMIKVSLSAPTWASRSKGERAHLLDPPQIDLIKDMGPHLFQWYYEARREQNWQKTGKRSQT